MLGGWDKSKILRYTGIFMLGLALSTAIAFATPMSIDKRIIFYPFTLLFIGYLGIDYILESRRAKDEPKPKPRRKRQ
jgi:hypothetical protein